MFDKMLYGSLIGGEGGRCQLAARAGLLATSPPPFPLSLPLLANAEGASSSPRKK